MEWLFPEMTATPLHDYIDIDGDMLAVDEVDGLLALSVIRHGKTAALTAILSDPDDARKIARTLTSWADRKEAQ
jgi:hypothetical protein